MYLKRKIDEYLLEWKEKEERLPLIIKGARQIGKTESINHFANQNYGNIVSINFVLEPKYKTILSDGYAVEDIIKNISMIDTSKKFIEGDTLIIFDELQEFPDIATALKSFKIDGRFDVICSGSLLGINYRKIHSNSVGYKTDYEMFSMDFEEFLWAVGDEITADTIKLLLKSKKSAGNAMHRNLMRMFRLYMLIGGMPQAVEAYLEHNNLQVVDEVKREIVDLYKEDFTKIDGTGLAGDIYDAIPASLSGNASRYVLSNAREGTRLEQVRELIPDILSSYTVNIAYHANNPGVGMSLEKDAGRYKLFTSDVGLFITLAFKDKKYTENIIYNKLLSDKLEANLGYIYENVVAQMLVARGNNLFYYTMESDTSNHLYEIDFLLSKGDKINPIEVKSGNYRGHKSLDMFCDKYSSRIRDQYVVHTKDYKLENGIHYLPVYMIPFL